MKLSNSIFALTLLLSFQTNTMHRLSRLNRIYRSSYRLPLSNPSLSNPLRLNTSRIPVNYFSTTSSNPNQQNQDNSDQDQKNYYTKKEMDEFLKAQRYLNYFFSLFAGVGFGTALSK